MYIMAEGNSAFVFIRNDHVNKLLIHVCTVWPVHLL